ncbi:hypothetical protein GCM10009555_050010 [Acrocarpospora macrocephala]|uniref:Uncharacterized protein n=1 Tax=Acrocarpospora macrocephala TaxID=150177 RepID=A0A5M3X438_9ACTN|nr:hypothetical protein [Acrocarpospora macrocephala]GES12878.1 hypothetical protein Amac_064750 [Acrocarpospora macrocephala]
MRISTVLAGAALLLLTPAMTPAQAATTSAASRCFQLPYFGPWGKADFDFGPATVEQLNRNGIRLEGITPVQVKRGNTGIFMPIGWQQDHIDPCRGVFYPGGFRMVNDKTKENISFERFYLRVDGVYFNMSVNGGPSAELRVGTYKLLEFMPTIATPRPLEGGVGPRVWPFYVDSGWSKAVKRLSGFTPPIGQVLGNLDAVVKYLP